MDGEEILGWREDPVQLRVGSGKLKVTSDCLRKFAKNQANEAVLKSSIR